MSQSIITTSVPGPIMHKLRLVRQRKIWVQVASAIVAAVAVLLAAMAVAMFIDWLATLYDSRWRVVLTVIALAAAACTTIGWIYFAWRRMLGIDRIASDVDRQFPRLEERWTTMTRLGSDANNTEIVHPAMLRRVASEAVRWEPHVEPEQVVSLFTLTRAMIGLTAISAILGLAVVFDSHHTLVLMHRFWRPASPISATELVDLPGDVVVGRGESLALAASLHGTPVDRATLFLRTDGADSQPLDLIAHGNDPIQFSHRFPAVEKAFEYRFRAGDGQSGWYTVGVAERPEIDVAKLTITPPAYTGREVSKFDNLPQRVSAIEGSELELSLRPKIDVEHIQLRFKDGKFAHLAKSDDGLYRWKTTLKEGLTFSPILTESHGLTNRRVPECAINVYPDQPPAVKIVSPDDQMAVRPEDTVEITFQATDDTGIDGADLVVYQGSGNESVQVASIPIPLGEQQGARTVQQSVDLDLKQFKAANGDVLSYEVRVRENRGAKNTGATPAPAMVAKDKAVPESKKSPSSPTSSSPTSSQIAQNEQHSQQPGDASQQKGDATQQPGEPASAATPSAAQSAQSDSQSSKVAAENSALQPVQPGTPSSPSASQLAKADQPPQPAPASADPQQPGAPSKGPSPSAAQIAKNDQPPSKSASGQGAQKPGQPSNASSPSASQTAKGDQRSEKATENNPASPNTSQTATSSDPKPQQGADKPMNDSATKQASASAATPNSPSASKTNPSASRSDKAATKSGSMAKDEEKAREATSGRQVVSSEMPKEDKEGKSAGNSDKASSGSPNASSQAANSPQTPSSLPTASNKNNSKDMPKSDQQASNSNSSNENQPNASKSASSSSKPDESASASSTPPPPDNMTRRTLDIDPQTSSSNRMRIKVDQFAGSFDGQQRAKVEMAIAPELEALDKALEKGQKTAGGVLDQLKAGNEWRETHSRDVSSAEHSTVDAQAIIEKLKARSKDTPYAFIGLQIADVGVAHVDPARSDFWKSLQSEGAERPESVRSGWQHLGRARELVAEMRGQFERTRREFQLAESVEKVKKMYQVYIENSYRLLQIQDSDPDFYNRKMSELKLDDDYLKRLKEVLEMRRDLEAELARILGDDPRLLRRFMDSVRNRTTNLRQELAKLVEAQNDLNREVRAWSIVEEADRPRIANLLLLRQVQDASKIATAAGELQSRYQAWLPLDRETKDAELAAASKAVQEAATVAGELNASAQRFVNDQQSKPAAPEATPAAAPAVEAAQPAQPAAHPVDAMLSDAQRLYKQLINLQVALRQISVRQSDDESAFFATNRLVDTQRLIADTSAWIRQTRAHKEGNYAAAAEVDQYRLAMKTDELAGKLGGIEQTFGGILGGANGGNKLPEPIAKKSREFIAALDKEASPNQLGAVYALHSNQIPRAAERQKAAGEALAKAVAAYDEMMKLAIAELDKLPVQDPIADLLDDPTLDELLAQLEQEQPLQELLGIPARPTNLNIIADWLRPGSGGGGGGGGRGMVASQMRQDQQRSRRKLDKAYRNALARALHEAKPKPNVDLPKGGKLSDWNILVSHLGSDLRQGRDKAPPEQYRRAIEQYFAEISRIASENKDSPPSK